MKKEKKSIGQFYVPSWDSYVEKFEKIFERQYYTNQGPLVDKLEHKIQQLLGVKNAICVTNAEIALMMVADALELSGKIVMPAFVPLSVGSSLLWRKNIEIIFCDICLETKQMDIEHLTRIMQENNINAVLATNSWGGCLDIEKVMDICKKNKTKVYFDSSSGFLTRYRDKYIGGFGEAEVFSFHSTQFFSTIEGGCITTNDNFLAEKLRNIRSSYGARQVIDVFRTANGRMSEAQAAIGLINLENLNEFLENNEVTHFLYKENIDRINNVNICDLSGTHVSPNYSHIICEAEEQYVVELMERFEKENIFIEKCFFLSLNEQKIFKSSIFSSTNEGLKNTGFLKRKLFKLPVGAEISSNDVEYICNIMKSI